MKLSRQQPLLSRAIVTLNYCDILLVDEIDSNNEEALEVIEDEGKEDLEELDDCALALGPPMCESFYEIPCNI